MSGMSFLSFLHQQDERLQPRADTRQGNCFQPHAPTMTVMVIEELLLKELLNLERSSILLQFVRVWKSTCFATASAYKDVWVIGTSNGLIHLEMAHLYIISL